MSRQLATHGFAFVRKTAFGFLTLSDVEVAMVVGWGKVS